VPALTSHSLRSSDDGGEPFPRCSASVIDLADRILDVEEEAGRSQLVALCTHVSVGLSGVHDLIDLVREPIVEHAADQSGIHTPLRRIVRELLEPGLGTRAMIRVLMLECMLDLLRRRLSAGDRALSWVAALDDQRVWKAVGLMLDKPGDPHSVQSLADAAGMSRSSFAKHFSEAYGTGAMELLRNIRVQRAANLLCETDLPVKRIADLVGFRSRSAFSRTFERFTGVPPREYRRA
jgi:AraC-like DNA-binding protein